jgi:hypothetical protein
MGIHLFIMCLCINMQELNNNNCAQRAKGAIASIWRLSTVQTEINFYSDKTFLLEGLVILVI